MTAIKTYTFQPTIPAGTPLVSPVTLAMQFPIYQVDRIEIKVPHGPNGNMGFYIALSGTQVIPYVPGNWLILDDDNLSWDFSDLPNSGAWELVGYNTGFYPHTVYVRFFVEPVPPIQSSSAAIIPSSLITGG